MESVWWVTRQLWDKGLVYEGHRVMPYSWRISTPFSNFEAGLNYKEVQDPALTLKFKTREGKHFLAWTTTPWTLPANLAAAVGKDIHMWKSWTRARPISWPPIGQAPTLMALPR